MLYYIFNGCAAFFVSGGVFIEPNTVGASAPYTQTNVLSIYTWRQGQWAYSPSFTGRKLITSAQVALTGYRKRDYLAAENRTHQQHTPRVTVWHHVYNFDANTNECTMQLVHWDHHVQTIPHTGGCKAYSEHYGHRYRQTPPDRSSLVLGCMPAYSAAELEEFSRQTGLRLTPELRRFYSGAYRLNQAALEFAAQQDFPLDAILPLQDQEGASVEGMHQLLKNLPCFQHPDNLTVIAMDACGDYFCATDNGSVQFYDHEQDQYFETDLDLRELME